MWLGGATGGYTTGNRLVVDLLRQKSRPYLFSNSLAPSVAGASRKVFEMLQSSNELGFYFSILLVTFIFCFVIFIFCLSLLYFACHFILLSVSKIRELTTQFRETMTSNG